MITHPWFLEVNGSKEAPDRPGGGQEEGDLLQVGPRYWEGQWDGEQSLASSSLRSVSRSYKGTCFAVDRHALATSCVLSPGLELRGVSHPDPPVERPPFSLLWDLRTGPVWNQGTVFIPFCMLLLLCIFFSCLTACLLCHGKLVFGDEPSLY